MLNWIHVFGELDMHILLCKDTGTMNRSLRLTECSQPISWVNATHFVYMQCVIENWV